MPDFYVIMYFTIFTILFLYYPYYTIHNYMKKKILASIAAGLVIFGGVFTPVFGLVIPQLGVHSASAEPQNVGTPSVCGEDFACSIMSAISEVIMFVPISIATISGMFFDYSVWSSIQSGTYTKYDLYDDSSPSSDGLVIMGWKLVRDFTNLIFIFALFVIGFTLILDLDGGAKVSMTSNPKRTLARVLMMALLVNFSFFIGRSVIDITNKLSLQFYLNMNAAPKVTESSNQVTSDVNKFYTRPGTESLRNIASGIIAKINPQSFLASTTASGAKPGTGNYSNLFFYSFVGAFFGLFLAYIFLSVALLFIGRTIGLYIAIIISPLAFVSFTVPFLQKQPYIGFDDWMKQFLGLAFMAPIFLFFLYIGIQFFDIPTGIIDAGSSGSFANAANILFKFAMIAMFLTLAKNISKDMAGKIGGMVTGLVTGAVTSVATIGAAAATGGASAAFVATRREAAQGFKSVSTSVLGEKNTEAIQQRMTGLKNFSSLRSNPRAALTGLATAITGSTVPDKMNQGWTKGKDLGKAMNRLEDLKAARERRLKQVGIPVSIDGKEDEVKAQLAEKEAKAIADQKIIDETRAKYNYDQRKAAMDAKNAQTGPKPKFGDGSAKMDGSDFSKKQQERILDKAIAAEEKRKQATQNAQVVGGPATPTTAPTNANTVAQPTKTASTQPAAGEAPLKATNTFNGDGKFDRPTESSKLLGPDGKPLGSTNEKPPQIVDVNGNPISSTDTAQRAESEKLTNIYNQEKKAEGETLHIDNLTVKNLNVQSNQGGQAGLPARTQGGSGTVTQSPQKQATTFLSAIQRAPQASSGALNYKSSDFAEKKPTTTSLILDTYGKPIVSTKPTPATTHDQNTLDQSSIIQDSLPGNAGDFDFGGMGPREVDHE